MRSAFFYFLLLSHFISNAQKTEVQVQIIVQGITAPVYLDAPHDGSNRMFVVEQTGQIRIIKEGKILPVPFLDVSAKMDKLGSGYSEKGLLGLAFHPQFKTNGRFYVYYSAPPSNSREDHHSVVAEYKTSVSSDVANANSEKVLMRISQPESNHNGGQMAFGPDGYLYIGTGDGGGGGDRHGKIGNGQDLTTHLGKILRIDVNSGNPYAVPPDNPFLKTRDAKPEIYAYGLRNPWRFSFDSKTGLLLCADVGQNKYEELNVITKGGNYGWRVLEGNHCFESRDCEHKGMAPPMLEYDHDEGISIIGGYVYRGSNKSYNGSYFFGDWNGKVWMLKNLYSDIRIPLDLKSGNEEITGSLNSFGQDEEGNIYLLMQQNTGPKSATGTVVKLLL
jgi:glucose/arabinose dehydrogenase